MGFLCRAGVRCGDCYGYADVGLSSGGRLGVCTVYRLDEAGSTEPVGLPAGYCKLWSDTPLSAAVLYQPYSDGLCVWNKSDSYVSCKGCGDRGSACGALLLRKADEV